MTFGVRFNNLLTVARILLTPLIPISFFFKYNLFGLVLFSVLCITDLLDGYYARQWKMESYVGQVLDPVADKCLALTSLFLLAYMQKLNALSITCTYIIILRELIVSGVRTLNQSVIKISSITKSTKLSKYKTLLINCAIFLFLVDITFHVNISIAHFVLMLGSIFSVISGIKYCYVLFELLKNEK